MQKYTTKNLSGHIWIEPEVAHGQEFYLASDVHALLTMLRGEIVSQSGLRNEYQDFQPALDAIDGTLGL